MQAARLPSAAARLGANTGLMTLNLDLVGQMSCNPAIGGIAKGHLVREIDALGGIMGRVIDRTGIQFRLLNRSRGPAVQSPRAQADRMMYRAEMRRTLEATSNLHLRQGKVVDLLVHDDRISRSGVGRRAAVWRSSGRGRDRNISKWVDSYRPTNLSARVAPVSQPRSNSQNHLKRLGFPVGRLKTGTPPRLDGRTIDWEAFEPQPGDDAPVPFSFSTDRLEAATDQLSTSATRLSVFTMRFGRTHRVTTLLGKDQRHRAALLSFDRGQGGEVFREVSASAFS